MAREARRAAGGGAPHAARGAWAGAARAAGTARTEAANPRRCGTFAPGTSVLRPLACNITTLGSSYGRTSFPHAYSARTVSSEFILFSIH